MGYYEKKITIKSWSDEDRPREKLATKGRRFLSDAELMAIIIGSGNKNESAVELSKRILLACNNDLNYLGKLSIQELSKFNGIGQAKAVSIIAAFELGQRRKDTPPDKKFQINTSADVYTLIGSQFMGLNHEEFWMILLNRSNQVSSKHLISKGGQASTIADPKIIFQTALEHHATSIIFAHNHPSGNLKPSQIDIDLTRKLIAAGELLAIAVLDHLIITDHGFCSLSDEGMI